MLNKFLVIGDLHLGRMGYSDYIKDGRLEEKNEVLSFIVEKSKLVDAVVFLGDQFNGKNPLSETVKDFTQLLESIGDKKKIFVIAGNHEIKAGGETSIDYLKEIKGKNWNIINRTVEKIDNLVFLPYQSKNSLNSKDNAEASKKIMESLPDGDILFHHHAVSGSEVHGGMSVDTFPEPILNSLVLAKKYKVVVGGHIHKPSLKKNVLVAGSIFNNEVGETSKYVWIIKEDFSIEKIPLPGRNVMKIENPCLEELQNIEKNNIIKVVITQKKEESYLLEIKKELRKFDCHIFLEQLPNERKRISTENGSKLVDMSIEGLLEVYAKQNNLSKEKLLEGFEIIKE